MGNSDLVGLLTRTDNDPPQMLYLRMCTRGVVSASHIASVAVAHSPRQHRSVSFLRSSPMSSTQSTQLSEYAQRQLSEDVIDFAAGQPGPSLLPLQHIAAAAADRLAGPKADPFILQYGPEQGNISFRRCLADFLSSETGHPVDPEELLITAGVSHGLDLACRHLGAVGGHILVEQPTYFLAGNILKQAGLTPVPVPTGPQGLDVDSLQRMLEQGSSPSPPLLYTIPAFNNPTGATIPLEQRQKLIQLAHQHDFVIIADEVYQLLSFPAAAPPPPPLRVVERMLAKQGLLQSCSRSSTTALQDNSAGGPSTPQQGVGPVSTAADSTPSTSYDSRVVSLGSFSKVCAPGLRLGWVDAAAPLLKKLRQDGVLGSGGAIAPLSSGIAHSLLELGLLQQHMHGTIRPTLQRNCAALCDALRQELPPGCKFSQPDGGYFVWLEIGSLENPDVSEKVCTQDLLAFAAANYKVKFTPGRVCDGQAHNLRLSHAFYTEEELKTGAQRLGAAIRAYLRQLAAQQ